MLKATEAILLYATAPTRAVADSIAHALIEAHLAACVNILPAMHSVYRWEGNIEHADELVLLIKTTAAHEANVIATITAQHPYKTPCAVTIPITGGNPDFLAWIELETTV